MFARFTASARLALAVYATVAALAFSAAPVAHAQAVPGATGADTIPRKPKPDSALKQRSDSIQHRIGRDNSPISLEIGDSYTFTRDDFYRSGALTLLDLLDRIPGITTFRSSFLAAPQVAAYGGDFGRVRVFYDGIEMDNLEPRNGAVPDLKWIPISSLERVTITRGANELRIDIRSWEYTQTTPYTRFDLLTGDENTTLYRIFYGKRFYNGTGLQIAGQQFNNSTPRNGGGGDETAIFGRYGIGRQWWSLDVTFTRERDTRTITTRNSIDFPRLVALPNYRSDNTLAYLRAAIGKEGSGPFLQLVASTQALKETSSHFNVSDAATYNFPPDTVDSTASLSQYVATAGYDRGPLRLRLIDRYRTRNGFHYNSPSATADFTTGILAVDALVEHDPYYGFTRLEAAARISPLPFLAFTGALGQRTADSSNTVQPDSRTLRLEGGLRLYARGPWLSAGTIIRDTAFLVAPIVFDSGYASRPISRTTGTTLSLRGPLGHGFSVDANAIHWNDTTAYIPRYQAHLQLEFATQWLKKFPSGNFSFRVIPMFDFRSKIYFPTAEGDVQNAASSKVISLLAEIRILRGEITYQRRNTNLILYNQVPGYLMPRGLNLYGVRWYFFN